MTDLVYVSITGLKLKKIWHAPVFWRHATASMSQAKKAEGCLSADAKTIGGTLDIQYPPCKMHLSQFA